MTVLGCITAAISVGVVLGSGRRDARPALAPPPRPALRLVASRPLDTTPANGRPAGRARLALVPRSPGPRG